MSEFFVGQKVVCVDEVSGYGRWEGDGPSLNAVYTIRRLFTDVDGDLVFHLDEIERGPPAKIMWGDDVGYGAYRFRPVEYKAMGIFRQIAKDVSEGKKVPADV